MISTVDFTYCIGHMNSRLRYRSTLQFWWHKLGKAEECGETSAAILVVLVDSRSGN